MGEVANIVGGGTPSTSNEKYWDGNIDWYAPAEIGEQIYAFWSIRKITEEGLKHSSAKLLPAFKTVLFTSRAGIGNMAVLQKDGATNQGFQSIVCNDCLVPYFVFSMGFQIKKKAERVAAGSTFSEISGKQLCDLEIMVTTDKEQLKIGSYFQSLDHLITLHQSKSFKCFFVDVACCTLSWEQRKLGEIGSVAMCRRIFKHQTTESGEIPFFKIGNFGGTPDAFISKDLFEDFKAKYPYPEKGAVLISASGSIGRTVVFTGKDEYFQDSNIVWLKHDNSITNSFLYHLYSIVRWVGIEGTTIKRLYNDNILKTEAIIPLVSEQQKISDYLDAVDHLITLHQLEPYYLIFKAIAYRIIDYAEYKFFNVKINLIHDIL
ncbi:hypothetical protein HMPREF0491_00463 [Lachnospiraceae oral taxon 107 str. F0167]|nr:hypothetical protein HMPREF0491_00463 [Lachnospiraceae oral taxon 107 str. F0167]